MVKKKVHSNYLYFQICCYYFLLSLLLSYDKENNFRSYDKENKVDIHYLELKGTTKQEKEDF